MNIYDKNKYDYLEREKCTDCVNYIYEKDTGMGWCRVDKEPKDCDLYYSQIDAKNDAKYSREDRY
jgi:hypothetical protein